MSIQKERIQDCCQQLQERKRGWESLINKYYPERYLKTDSQDNNATLPVARIGRKNIKEQITLNEVDLVAVSLASWKHTFVACLLISILYVPSLLSWFFFVTYAFFFQEGVEGCFLYSLWQGQRVWNISSAIERTLCTKNSISRKVVRIKCNILPKIGSQSEVFHAFLELQEFGKVRVFTDAFLVPLIPLEWTGSFMTLPEYCPDKDCGHSKSVFLINLVISVEGI